MGARTRMAYWADIRHPTAETKSLSAGIPEAYRPLSDAELVDEAAATFRAATNEATGPAAVAGTGSRTEGVAPSRT
jgi:hypothetical protein